jgi:hypothetical protein|tara:strand:- start:446 stop:1081 length:636 start_codon:yes stop_codon:yes gene_type:complete
MWAIVKNSQLIEISNGNKPITVGDVVHPKDVFKHWTKSQLKEIGIYEFISGTQPNSRFETQGAISYVVDDDAGTVTESIAKNNKNINDVNEVDENGDPLLDEYGDQVVTKGLKTIYKEQIKQQATSLLAPTDWMVVRKAEDSTKSIPSAVTTYRASVRTKADEICTAIDNCDTLDKLKALFETTYNDDGSVNVLATMQTLPDDNDIKDYKR